MTRWTILSSFETTSRRAAAAGYGIFSRASIMTLLTSMLVLATSSCSGAGSSIVGSNMQDVQSFQAAAGDNQVGTAGSELPTPLTVRALTQGGQGVSGISVRWTFSGGGGSLTPGGTVSKSLTTVTDKQGKSSVYWQLDTIAGGQTATAALSGAASNSTKSIKFHSNGKAGGPATLVVSPSADTLAVGDSTRFTAKVLDRWKNVISGATVSWSSSNDSVVTVRSTGMAKALRSGSASVIATTSASSTTSQSVGGSGTSSISGQASVNVASSLTTGAGTPQTATVTVTPASLSFSSLNATAQLSAVAKDSTGNTVTNPGFTWKSLATSIATVSATGLVTAKAVGATAIIVTTACCGVDTIPVAVSTPMGAQSLLPGCTVNASNHVNWGTGNCPASVPSGWTLVTAQGFESGSIPSSQFLWGGAAPKVDTHVRTEVAHTGTYSAGGTYHGDGNSVGWQLDAGQVNSQEIYVSWWEYDESQGRLNDEMFLMRPYVTVGGQLQQEVIFDWFGYNNIGGGKGGSHTGFNATTGSLVIEPQGIKANGGYTTTYHMGYYGGPTWGHWDQWEIHFKANDPGSSNGEGEIYKNGVLLAQKLNANMNGMVDMKNMAVEVGGVYTKLTWWNGIGTFSPPGSCTDYIGDGQDNGGRVKDFSQPAPCANEAPPNGYVPIFNRYFDDIIVLKR